MKQGTKRSHDVCECGGKAKRGQGDFDGLMTCNRPSCKKRWLVKRCNCGNFVDFRYQQCCDKNYSKCNIVSYDVCIIGSRAKVGFESVMYCSEKDCSCHHSRWAYHECSQCGHMVDYRYAVMCRCKKCTLSKQYYRICPVCGHCPSQCSNAECSTSKIIKLKEKKPGSRATAHKKIVKRKAHPRQQSLGV